MPKVRMSVISRQDSNTNKNLWLFYQDAGLHNKSDTKLQQLHICIKHWDDFHIDIATNFQHFVLINRLQKKEASRRYNVNILVSVSFHTAPRQMLN